MYTYNLKVRERTVQIKMLKADAEHTARQIRDVLQVPQYKRELWGTLGEDEHSSLVMSLFGPSGAPLADPAKYQQDVTAFIASLPDLITSENAPAVLTQAAAIFKEHVPVEDKRKSPEEEKKQAEEWKRTEAQQQEQHETARLAWAQKYCDSAEEIPVPEGMIPVLLEANYDDSDAMTDYFHDHCGHGWEMLLGFVPAKSHRTEALHREFVNKYPDLAAMPWKWGKQDYSMGHGYWLQSPAVGTIEEKTTYGGYKNPPFWWEVSFGYGRGKSFMAYKGFAQANRRRGGDSGGTSGGETVQGNGFTIEHERDWTWVHFPGKPADDILERLRNAGGRFSRRRLAWYFTRPITAEELGLTPAETTETEGEAQASPAPVQVASHADHLRELADAMQKDIDAKLDSATGRQNYTARRARIAEGMRKEGYFLEKVQAALRTLAEAHEAGTVPEALRKITSRKAVTDLLYKQDADLLALIEGKVPDRASEEEAKKQEAEARRLVGIIPGYFPTPDPVIDRMLSLAPVGSADVCLEPEAGAGHIARRLRDLGAEVDTIEWSSSLCDVLQARGFTPERGDFLETTPNGKRYTRILMNPPFEKGQDMQHIRHAYDFLAEGGRLVSVASPGVSWRSDYQHAEFRQWLEDHGGETYDLPEGAFEASGTGVNALLVVIDK